MTTAVSPAYAGVHTDLRLTLSWSGTWRERPAPPPRPRRTSGSRARQQLSVHGADISGPAVGKPSGNRWNSRAPFRLATPVRG